MGLVLKFINLSFLFYICIPLPAQNLVPNGGFESLINLPIKPNPKNAFEYEPLSGYKPYISNMANWFAATESTPDLRITDLNQHKDCIKKFDDCNRCKGGIISIGIITYQNNVTYTAYREYLEVKLKEPLEIGKTINIEFWARKEREAKLITNNLGCYLSLKKVYADIADQIKVTPQFNFTEVINDEETKWTKISTQLVVDKAYEYLTIGNFFSNEETTVKEYEDYTASVYIPPYAYYLVDDVKLWYEGTEPTEPPPTKTMRRKPVLAKNVYTKDFIIENVQVEFEYDKADLLNDQSIELDAFIKNLKNSPSKYNLHVIGHTDERGSNNYNLDLSLKRAQTVVKYFIKNGITPSEIISSGKGETQPLVKNDSEENRRLNRRVEVRLSKVK